ncbi:hypothetical protein VNI00_002778 [Paramarasmius palmivorus]|uniref:VLRF1 domain-containing protein n=1 Tax=Paramarasmius palmivorus TaxID=297713 RepID=A0AAW0DX81_9AGAR
MYYLYSLPQQLLDTLTPRNLLTSSADEEKTPEPQLQATNTVATGPRACNVCLGISFSDVEQQRAHFRTDWHRYNVKVRLNGGQPVAEQDFAQLLDGLEDSISGSESSNDSEGSSDSDAIVSLLNKHRVTSRPDSPTTSTPSVPQSAIAWFHSPPSTQIGVYRTVFPRSTPKTEYLPALKALQHKTPDGRKWAMFMVAGGHFAGAVIRVSRPEVEEEEEQGRSKKKPKGPPPNNEVLRHKTFHRYTTRRKQGGSQSLNDNAKGNAKSAGALLRRYGEQALRDDIRNLLSDWADEIDECELIFIRASGSNRKIFIDYDGCIITKGDERLRTFPFPTRRPTQSEITRCLNELTFVKVSHLTEEALRAQDEAYLASLPKPKVVPTPAPASTVQPEKPAQPKLTKEEERLQEQWARLLDMIVKGRVEPLKAFWEREGGNLAEKDINTRIPDGTGVGGRLATLLHVASHAGQDGVVTWLLEDMHADPTIKASSSDGVVDSEAEGDTKPPKGGSTAYDVARSKSTRDTFRRCAAAHPDWWDWFGAGNLPSALHKEVEDEREEKKKARRKGLKDRIKDRESKEKEKSDDTESKTPEVTVRESSSTGSRKLGGGSGDVESLAGLNAQMRAKVERERRARAAEARLLKLGGATG